MNLSLAQAQEMENKAYHALRLAQDQVETCKRALHIADLMLSGATNAAAHAHAIKESVFDGQMAEMFAEAGR